MLLAIGLVISTTMFAQFRLDVEGDAKIKGALDLLNAPEDSSIIIGYEAGRARRILPLNRKAKARFVPGPPNNPNGVQQAMLRISDTNGKVLKEETLRKVGRGQIQIKATHFPTGTYYYSLILDGQLFETKRMILVWK